VREYTVRGRFALYIQGRFSGTPGRHWCPSVNYSLTEYIHLFLNYLDGRKIPLYQAYSRTYDLIHMFVMLRDAGQADCGHLPQFMVIHFSDGQIELFAQARDKRFHNAALILKGPAPGDMYLQPADADTHRNPIRYPGVI
jgi:hypothetical protein